MALARKLAYLEQAALLQWLPPRAIRAYQLRKLRALLEHCEREVPFYRESFRNAGIRARDVRTLEDLAQLPTIGREEVQAAYPSGILSRAVQPGDVELRTSGTSGLFMRIAYSAEAFDRLDAVYARALFATGYK